MNGVRSCALALGLIVIPCAALAQPGGRPAPPAPRAAPPPPPPVQRAAPPPSRPAPPQPGFSFPRDIPARAAVAPPRPVQPRPQRPPVQPQPQRRAVTQPQPQQRAVGQRPGSQAATRRPPVAYRTPPFNPNHSGGPYHGRFHGPVVGNPHRWQPWQWNHGRTWQPAPIYWGGGFWGPFALGGLGGLPLFGWVPDDQSQLYYPSYQAEPDSPGAQLLENYGLQQTECGAPNLVVIWGPDDSVICAYPNDLVAPGNYELDPTTLTIESSS